MPLSDEDRRHFVEGALARKVPPERIKADLAKLEGRMPMSIGVTPPNLAQAGADFQRRQANIAAGRTPEGLTQQEQAEGGQFYKETLPRAALATGVGLVVAPITGGMSMIPGALTEGGLVGGADVLYQAARKLIDPSRTINPRESFDVGMTQTGASLGTGAVLKGIERTAGFIGRVPKTAMQEVEQRAPLGGPPAYRMMKRQPAEAEKVLAEEASTHAIEATAPSLPKAEAAVKAYKGDVDMQPVFDHILSRYRDNPVNAGEDAANKALEDLANRLPQKMNMKDMEDYLRRIRRPVKEGIGKEGGTLISQDTKGISAFIRKYRDELLGTQPASAAGVEEFAKSSAERESIKRFKKLLLDPYGNLRAGAEATIRKIPNNRVLMDIVQRYDDAMGTTFAQKIRDLGLNREWNPQQVTEASGIAEMLAAVSRRQGVVARSTAASGKDVAKAMLIAGPTVRRLGTAGITYEEAQRAFEQAQRQSP